MERIDMLRGSHARARAQLPIAGSRWRRFLTSALVALLLLAATPAAFALNVAIYRGPGVQNCGDPGPSDCEPYTLQQAAISQGHTVTAFTGTTLAAWTAALAGQDALIIPEQETGPMTSTVDAAARAFLATWVSNGGGLVLHADGSNHDVLLLNSLFGWAVADSGIYFSNTPNFFTRNDLNAAGTAYATGPAGLPDHNGSYTWLASSLPVGALCIYERVIAGECALFIGTSGLGRIAVEAFDGYEAAPVGSQSAWLGTQANSIAFTGLSFATTTLLTTRGQTSPGDPTPFGEPVVLIATVTNTDPGSVEPPSGTIVFADENNVVLGLVALAPFGPPTPGGTQARASLQIAPPALGTLGYDAFYNTSANFVGSNDSDPHTVVRANSTTNIALIVPPGPLVGETTTISVSVSANPPGAGTPTGSVVITGTDTAGCTVTLSGGTGSCDLTFTAKGVKPILATYGGDTFFEGSADNDNTVPVAGIPTTLTITSTVAHPSFYGNTFVVNYLVTGGSSPFDGTVLVTLYAFDPDIAFRGSLGDANCSGPVAPDGTGSCTITTTLPVGEYEVEAFYSGDATDDISGTTTQFLHEVVQATTSLALTLTPPGTAPAGATVTANLVLSLVDGTGPLAGSILVFDGSGPLCLPITVPGPLTCDFFFSTTGPKTVQATFTSTDPNVAGSNSNTVPYNVTPAASTTTITGFVPPSPQVGDVVRVNFTVSDGFDEHTGPVSVTVASAPVACAPLAFDPVSGIGSCDIPAIPHFQSVGSPAVTVNYGGDPDELPSSDSEIVTIAPRTTTATVTPTPSSPQQAGTPITFDFTVSAAGGSFAAGTFPPGGATLVCTAGPAGSPCTPAGGGICGGPFTTNGPGTSSGSCTVAFQRPGTFTLELRYAGSPNFAPSNSAPFNFTIDRATTTITIGNPGTLAASTDVGEPVLVTFDVDGGAVLGPDRYSGLVEVTATLASPALTRVCQGTVNATTGVGNCTLQGAQRLNNSGSWQVTARYIAIPPPGPGDINDTDSISAVVAHPVVAADTTTELTTGPDPSRFGQAWSLLATVTANPPGVGPVVGSVEFFSGTTSLGIVPLNASGTANLAGPPLNAGTAPFSVTFLANANFNASVDTDPHTVIAADVAVAISGAPNPSVAGQPVTFTATVSTLAPGAGTPTGTVLVTAPGGYSCTTPPLVLFAPNVSRATCDIMFTEPATLTVSGAYDNTDGNFNDAGGSTSQTINRAPATITIGAIAPPSPQQAGTTISVPFTVTGGFGGNAGLVSIVASGPATVTLCSGVSAGFGACGAELTVPGTYTITASYNVGLEDTNDTSDTDAQSYTIVLATTTLSISFTDLAPPPGTYAGETVRIAAQLTGSGSLSPTGTITITRGASPVCTITAPNGTCDVTFDVVGALVIDGNYPGDSFFNPASDSEILQVDPAPTTTTITNIVPAAPVVGEPVTISFSVAGRVAPDTGTVDVASTLPSASLLCDDVALSAGGVGQCTYTFFDADNYTIVASYSGDANDAPSDSAATSFTVAQADTALTLADNPDPQPVGQLVTFTASLTVIAPGAGTPTGTVRVRDSLSNELCTIAAPAAAAVGGASCTYAFSTLGTQSVAAYYDEVESDDYEAATSATITHESIPAPTTLTITGFSPVAPNAQIGFPVTVNFQMSGGFGQSYEGSITASATRGATTVNCLSPSFDPDRDEGGDGSCTFPAASFQTAGDWSFTVSFVPAPASDDGASSDTENYEVQRGEANVNFSVSPPGQQNAGAPITFTVTVTPDNSPTVTTAPTGVVAIIYDGNTLCTITVPGASQCTAQIDFPDVFDFTASYPGDANFTPASAQQSYEIVRAPTTTTVTADTPDPSVTGQPVAISYTVTGGVAPLSGNVTVTFANVSWSYQCTASVAAGTCSVTPLHAGNYDITAAYEGDINDAPSTSASVAHVILRATTSTTLVVVPTPNSEIGQPVQLTATVTVNAPGGGIPQGQFEFFDGTTAIELTSLDVNGQATFTTSSLSLGLHTLRGVFTSTADYVGSNGDQAHTVLPATTTTAITVLPTGPNARIGEAVTVNFDVDGGFGPGYEGTVTVSATNGAANATCAPVTFDSTRPGGTGTCTFAQSAFQFAGPWTFTATFVPNVGSDDAGSFGTASYALNRGTSVTTLAIAPPGSQETGATVTFTATVVPGDGDVTTARTGTVTVQDDLLVLCTITLPATSCTSSFNQPDTLSVTAYYSGDDNFLSSQSAPQSYDIVRADTSITVTAIAPTSVVVGQQFTTSFDVNGQVTPDVGPAGTVSLNPSPSGSPFCGPSSLAGDGTGSCAYTPFTAGTINYTAEYSGDSNDLPSSSAVQSIVVGEAATTLTLAQSTTTSTVGELVTFTATISVDTPGSGTPTGTIVVSSSLGTLCTIDAAAASASGGATCNYTFGVVGTFDVTATYADSESPNYLGSTSNTVSHEVTAAVTFMSVSVASGTPIGEPVTVNFTLAGGFGPAFEGSVAITANPGAIACGPVTFNNSRPTGTGSCTFPANTFQLADNYTFTAAYTPATPFDDAASTDSTTVAIEKGTTVATLTIVPPATQVVGQLATFQVAVTVPDTDITTAPTGAVVVFNALTFTPICVFTLPATECTHSFDLPATLSVTAQYTGDDNFLGDTSESQEYTITRAPTNVAITSVVNSPSVVGETVTVSFAVTGGHQGNDGTVTIDSGPANPTCSAPASAGSCLLTFTSANTYALSASYNGDANDLPSTSAAPTSHTVNQAATTLSLVQSASVAQIGQSVDFTVDLDVVAPGAGIPGGNIVVFYGTTTICTITAASALDGETCSHVFTALGIVEVAAVYGEAEDPNFGASADDVSHETIPADTFMAITSITPAGVRIGDPVTVSFELTGGYGPTFDGSATVAASNGATCTPVTFNNARPTGTGTCTFAAGAFQLAGSYDFTAAFVPGVGSDDAASSDTDSFAIDRGTTTTTLSISPPGQQFAGSDVVFTVNVARNDADVSTAVTGTVAVTDGASPVCTITLPATSCTVAFPTPRTLNLEATYSGDANFEASASAPQSYLIEFVPTTTTITADTPDPTVTGEPFTVSYSVTGGFDGNAGDVTVTATGPATYTCTNPASAGSCVITPFRAGLYALTASYAGDTNDAGSTTAVGTPHLVTRATTTLTFTVSPSPQVFGETVTLTATVTANAPGAGIPQGTVVFLDNGASFAEIDLDASGVAVYTTSSFAIGTHPLRADFAQTADYLQSFFDVNHEVLRYPTTTTITSDAPDPSVAGQPVVVQYAVSSSGGTPTGNVTVTATPGGQTCTATVAAGQCTLTFATAVNRTLVAAYAGDALNQPSTSANEPHTVNKADTLVTITSDTPDPTAANQPYTVAVSVAAVAPGAGTPSGTVAISDGVDGCSITLTGGTGSCSMASTTPGNKTLTATYAGDADFNGNSDTEPHEVLRIVTTTTLAAPTPVVVGQPATFVYTVTSADGSTATGAVSIVNTADSSVVCTGSVAAGQCQAAFPTAGTRTLRAEYAGDATHAPSVSGTQTLAVNQASTTTTITSDTPDPSEVTTPYTVAVSVTVNAPGAGTPGGTITVSDGTDSCTITLPAASCALTSTTLGSKTLTATYAGDANFNGSSGTAAHEVVRIATTTTITGAVPAPSVTGQAVVFSYTVATGTGTATGNVTLTAAPGGATCTGTVAAGQCTITFASAGARTVTAAYAGDATHATSSSAPFGHTVNAASTTTTITSDAPDPSEVGQGYVVQVTVAPVAPGAGIIGGTVAVSDGTDGCSITLVAGTGQCVLTSTTAGAKTLTATYAGNADFASSSGTTAHTVNAMTTTTALTATPATVVVGQPVTFTYTVTPATGPAPTGTVTVTNTADASVLCSGTVAAGSCSASFATVGTKSVRASYGGDATHATSQSTIQTVTVNKANTTLTITSDAPDPSAVNSAYSVVFTLAVSAPGAGTPTGTVTVSDGSASCIATLPATSCSLTSTTVGGKTLTATYAGDANFNGSTDDESHLVVQIVTTTTITSDNPDPSVVGQVVTIVYTVSPATATGTVTVTASSGESCGGTVAAGQCTITFANAGSRNLTAVYGGDANHAGSSSAAAAHIVNAAATTTTITSDTPDPSAVEQAVTFSVTVTTNAPGAGTPTGSVTVGPVGESCSVTLSSGSGSCTIAYQTAGLRNVTATYAGTANFAASTSVAEPHTVGTRGTVVSILSDSPDRSTPSQSVTVVVSFGLEDLTGLGVDAPTGSIQITDGVDSCQIALPATSCSLTLTSRGPRTLTATYPGDANYDPSTDTESHLVNRLPAAVNDAYSTPQGTTLVANDATGLVTPGNANDNGVLANDGDADGDTLTVTNTGAQTAGGFGGSVSLGSTGTFTYVPPASGSGTATFPVQVNDGYETFTTTATITVQGIVDLAITKTNSVTVSGYGDTVVYVIVVNNIGGSPVVGATVQDLIPSSLTAATWTCTGSNGGICPASGSGDINRLVDLPLASSVTFTLTATVQPGFSGLLTNTATVTVPASQVDSQPGNNTATDNDDVRTFIDGFEN